MKSQIMVKGEMIMLLKNFNHATPENVNGESQKEGVNSNYESNSRPHFETGNNQKQDPYSGMDKNDEERPQINL